MDGLRASCTALSVLGPKAPKEEGWHKRARRHRELGALEGWDGCVGGRFEREGINVYTWLIDFVVQRNEHKIVRQLYSN